MLEQIAQLKESRQRRRVEVLKSYRDLAIKLSFDESVDSDEVQGILNGVSLELEQLETDVALLRARRASSDLLAQPDERLDRAAELETQAAEMREQIAERQAQVEQLLAEIGDFDAQWRASSREAVAIRSKVGSELVQARRHLETTSSVDMDKVHQESKSQQIDYQERCRQANRQINEYRCAIYADHTEDELRERAAKLQANIASWERVATKANGTPTDVAAYRDELPRIELALKHGAAWRAQLAQLEAERHNMTAPPDPRDVAEKTWSDWRNARLHVRVEQAAPATSNHSPLRAENMVLT
jgi:hypothetical protein